MTAIVDDLFTAAQELGVLPVELKGEADVREQVRVHAGLGDLPVRAEQWRAVRARVEALVEEVVRRSNHGGQCRACGALIIWGQTETGKPMSVDPLPRPGGNVVRMPQGKRQVLRVLPPAALPVVGRPAYQSHFVSCPFADQMRKRRTARERRGGGAADGPMCTAPGCELRTPLDEAVVAEGFTTHPTCGPDEQPKRES